MSFEVTGAVAEHDHTPAYEDLGMHNRFLIPHLPDLFFCAKYSLHEEKKGGGILDYQVRHYLLMTIRNSYFFHIIFFMVNIMGHRRPEL